MKKIQSVRRTIQGMILSSKEKQIDHILLIARYLYKYYDEHQITIDIWKYSNAKMIPLLQSEKDNLTVFRKECIESDFRECECRILSAIEDGSIKQNQNVSVDVLDQFYQLKKEDAAKNNVAEREFIKKEITYVLNELGGFTIDGTTRMILRRQKNKQNLPDWVYSLNCVREKVK